MGHSSAPDASRSQALGDGRRPPILPPAPAGTPKQRAAFLIRAWLGSEGHPEDTISRAILMLDEDHMRAQPADIYGLEWPPGGRHGVIPPVHWRYRFRREISHLLGWREQRPEGHPDGFPAALNQAIREELWPNLPAAGGSVAR